MGLRIEHQFVNVFDSVNKIGGIFISKKKGFIGALIVIVLIFGVKFFFSYQEKTQIMNDTLSHLENRGYDVENDIEEVNIVEILESNEHDEIIHTDEYEAVVYFKDEPKNAYFYRYEKGTNKITQTDSVNEGTNQELNHIE